MLNIIKWISAAVAIVGVLVGGIALYHKTVSQKFLRLLPLAGFAIITETLAINSDKVGLTLGCILGVVIIIVGLVLN